MKVSFIATSALSAPARRKIEKKINALLRALPSVVMKKMPQEASVIFTTPAESKKLNVIYRGKQKPANVLSFPYDKTYGEIFVTPAVVRKEALKSGEKAEERLVKMIIHGMLHLSGLDHEISANDAEAFERLEEKLIRLAL